MNRDLLKTIIADQHEVIKNVVIYNREYQLEDNANYILIGLRRSGKSTLLYKKALDLIKKGVSWEQIIYINFEDERLAEFNIQDFQDILLVKNELTRKKAYYFFDEIQNIDGWEKFARRLADQNETIYITGSNSKMFSSEMSAKLGGRYLAKYIMPYSFNEYLLANKYIPNNSTKNKAIVNNLLKQYLTYGGLPETVKFINKREYISSVFDKVFFNDIILHNKIRNEQAIRLVVKKIAETVKDEISYTKLHNIVKSIGFTISKDTVIDYVSYIVNSYLIFRVENYYSAFIDKESIPKYYFYDNGILNLFLLNKDSILLENLVAIYLKRLGQEFYYLKSTKTGVDIDFYIPNINTAIQVSYSLKDVNVRDREISQLIKFSKLNKNENKLYIVTYDEKEDIEIDGVKIKVLSLLDLLKDNYIK